MVMFIISIRKLLRPCKLTFNGLTGEITFDIELLLKRLIPDIDFDLKDTTDRVFSDIKLVGIRVTLVMF